VIDQSGRESQGYRQLVILLSSRSVDCVKDVVKGSECRLASNIIADPMREIISIGMRQEGDFVSPTVNFFNSPCMQFDSHDPDLIDKLSAAVCRANCFCPYEDYKQVVGTQSCDAYAECVYVSATKTTSDAANDVCDVALVNIFDAEKQAYMNQLMASADNGTDFPWFIGLSGVPPAMTWGTGETLNPGDYTNWAKTPTSPDGESLCTFVQLTGLNHSPQWQTSECKSRTTGNAVCQLNACQSGDMSCLQNL